jgi:hypothetical protein
MANNNLEKYKRWYYPVDMEAPDIDRTDLWSIHIIHLEIFKKVSDHVYEFDKYMPQGMMSRLIVGLNHHIVNHNLVWHRGVNISLNSPHAEIIESCVSIISTGLYNVRVTAPTDECLMKVYVDDKLMGTSSFRVRNLPVPIGTIGGFSSAATCPGIISDYRLGRASM